MIAVLAAAAGALLALVAVFAVLLARRARTTPHGISLEYHLERVEALEHAQSTEREALAAYFSEQARAADERTERLMKSLSALVERGQQSAESVIGALAAVKGPQVIYPPEAPQARGKPPGRVVMDDENEVRVAEGLDPIEEELPEGMAPPIPRRTLGTQLLAAETALRRGGPI